MQCIRSFLNQASHKLLHLWCHGLGLTLCVSSCRFVRSEWFCSKLCYCYCFLCFLKGWGVLFSYLLSPLAWWQSSFSAHSQWWCHLWVLHSCTHADELLCIPLLLLDVWKDECWLVCISQWPGTQSDVSLAQLVHHGFACSKVAMSCPHLNHIELIPIVSAMGWPALSHTTDNADGFLLMWLRMKNVMSITGVSFLNASVINWS